MKMKAEMNCYLAEFCLILKYIVRMLGPINLYCCLDTSIQFSNSNYTRATFDGHTQLTVEKFQLPCCFFLYLAIG